MTTKTSEFCRDILLTHKGAANPISAREMAAILGIDENDTFSATRDLIFRVAMQYNLPVAASQSGYYIITNENEYVSYIKQLNSRINGIEHRKAIVARNWSTESGTAPHQTN